MKLERPTIIDLQTEAVTNSRARSYLATPAQIARIATRDARAHHMLSGLRPSDCLHIASMGELSLHDLAGALADHYGPFEVLTLATWAASEEAIKRLISLRESGQVKRLEALVDTRCPTDCPDAHALLNLSFDLYRTASNHAKVLALTGGACGIAVVATANLTRNPRCEVAVVSMDSVLAAFHRDWIREVIANAE